LAKRVVIKRLTENLGARARGEKAEEAVGSKKLRRSVQRKRAPEKISQVDVHPFR
jgi:hypothetical protein